VLIAPRSPQPQAGLQNWGLHIGLIIGAQPQPHGAAGKHPLLHPDLSLITTLSAGHPHPHPQVLIGTNPPSQPYLSLTTILSVGPPHPQPQPGLMKLS